MADERTYLITSYETGGLALCELQENGLEARPVDPAVVRRALLLGVACLNLNLDDKKVLRHIAELRPLN